MCVLPDWMIRDYVRQKRLVIDPFDEKSLQPASYDFRLGNRFLFVKSDVTLPNDLIDLVDHLETEEKVLDKIVLWPNQSVLGMTKEYFALSDVTGAKVYVKSGIGRLFTQVAGDAGWWDPGFSGYGVLELKNSGLLPVTLLAGQRIGQLVFEQLVGPADVPYNGNFQEQQDFAVDRWKKSLSKLVREVSGAEEQVPTEASN